MIKRSGYRILLLIIVYSLLIFLGIKAADRLLAAPDFTAYWAASHLALSGENPYSADAVWRVQQDIGLPYDRPMMMYNPPWSLALVLPLGLLPYSLARLLWLLFGVIIILFTSAICWRLYEGSPERLGTAMLLGITFVPALIGIQLGQTAPLILLGVGGFLYSATYQKWGLAGVSIYLMALKPHLMYLFWPALIIWLIKEKQWQVVLSFLLVSLTALLIPMIFNQRVILQYLNVDDAVSPLYWQTPLLSSVLRMVFGSEKSWLQFTPSIFGLIWLASYWSKHRADWQWKERMPMLLLISFLTTWYGWGYDLIIFLPILLQSVIWFSNGVQKPVALISLYIFADGILALLTVISANYFFMIWAPPFFLILYIYASHLRQKMDHPAINSEQPIMT